MKVSYQGKVKCVSKVALNMSDLRKNVSRKFKERDPLDDSYESSNDLT